MLWGSYLQHVAEQLDHSRRFEANLGSHTTHRTDHIGISQLFFTGFDAGVCSSSMCILCCVLCWGRHTCEEVGHWWDRQGGLR